MLTSRCCTPRPAAPSIPPERLLRASLIQTLSRIRQNGATLRHVTHNLLYRWFVGLDMDDKVWDHSSFTKNRDRLLNESVARAFFGKVFGLAQWHGLVSSDHFSVDGTLIEASASMEGFMPQGTDQGKTAGRQQS